MSEGMLMFVRLRRSRGRAAGDGRPADLPGRRGAAARRRRQGRARSARSASCCARGPYTLRGYYGAPEHNQQAFTPDGFYRSGDLMRQHPSGNYMVEGRKKDLINRGGEKISAEEIENLILSHPAVQNVACVAVPDPDLGERMCACVILRAGASADPRRNWSAFLDRQGDREVQAAGAAGGHGRFPLSTFGKVSKKIAGRDDDRGSSNAGAADERRERHARDHGGRCDRSTCTAIPTPSPGSTARGPMSRRWPNTGSRSGRPGSRKTRSSHEFADRRRRGGAGRARSRDRRPARRRAATNTWPAMQQRHPGDASSRPGPRSIRFKGESAIAEAKQAINELGMLGFHFHPIMGHFAVNDRRSIRCSRPSTR